MEMIKNKEEKLQKKAMSEADKNSAWAKKVFDKLAKASAAELVTYDKSTLQAIGAFGK
jgi:hypothetical protein